MEIICGIYKITSPSGKINIGQAVNIYKRWREYRNLNCTHQIRLYRSFKKYSVETHKFEIIEICIREELNTKERYWQEYYNSTGVNGLNCFLQGTIEKPRIISEEHKKRISIANSGRKRTKEAKLKISLANSGRICSEETRLKMSISQKGKKRTDEFKKNLRLIHTGKKHTKETKDKISKSHKGIKYLFQSRKGKPILQYTKNNIFIKEWDSAKTIQSELKIYSTSITACCKNRKNYKSAGGYKWKYK